MESWCFLRANLTPTQKPQNPTLTHRLHLITDAYSFLQGPFTTYVAVAAVSWVLASKRENTPGLVWGVIADMAHTVMLCSLYVEHLARILRDITTIQ